MYCGVFIKIGMEKRNWAGMKPIALIYCAN